MIKTRSAVSENKAALQIAVLVLLFCWTLFYLDYETKSVADLFKAENLAALLFYFIPTFLTTFLLFRKFRQKKSQATSMLLALMIGVPVSFALVIAFMLAMRP